MLQFRMLGVIEHTALYGQNQPDIRYAYVCTVERNRIDTKRPVLLMIKMRHAWSWDRERCWIITRVKKSHHNVEE